ncbi:2371_t:CDS:2, partial [Gigaspora margarita]
MNTNTLQIPNILPIVPIKNKVLFPGTALPLQIGRKDTAQLMQRIYKSVDNKDTKYFVGCVPVKPPVPTTTNSTNSEHTNTSSKKVADETPNQSTPTSELHEYGCAARIIRLERPVGGIGGRFFVVVEGIKQAKICQIIANTPLTIFLNLGIARIHIDQYIFGRPYLEAEVTVYPEPVMRNDDQELQDLAISLKSTGRELFIILQDLKLPVQMLTQLQKFIDGASPGSLADLLISTIEPPYEEKLKVLDAHDLKSRMTAAIDILTRQIHMLKITQKIHSTVEGKLDKKHKEFYLRQQLNAIKEELGERDDTSAEEDDVADLTRRLQEAGLTPDGDVPNALPDKAAQRELKRLKRMHPTQAEYQIVRTYLEWLSEIPWSK